MKCNKKGFTLLEIIIVVIIIGVLASLALPRLFSTVEFSRGSEALAAISSVRSAMDRCALRTGTYASCNTFGSLDIPDPATAPGAHFGTYAISGASATNYTITATRNTINGGATNGTIAVTQTTTAVTRTGTTAFAGI